ncbi:hypothetical protein MN032_11935 [Agromyces atrinae]|uniref:hypothetical protein n=1 Tax=Agromyces atrinae TaxID=592376 RepID=UPI001F55CDC7|nr:hypothetical protein [Agromyces atrinae]MCI2958404.1 hypothetical protein [Agromyces atrinae]
MIESGVGRRFGERPTGNLDAPVEAIIDAAAVSWYPPFAAEVAAIRAAFEREARSEMESTTAAMIASDPRRRDTVTPAPWRTGLRVLGFLAGATALAGILISLGVSRRNQPPIDASVAAVVVGIASVIALVCLGASLLTPSRMGVPNRMTSISLGVATVGALGSALALLTRPATWDETTIVWWLLIAGSGLAMAVLLVIVLRARHVYARSTTAVTDTDVDELRLAIITRALDAATRAADEAWSRVPLETRRAIESERDDAIDAIEQRTPALIDAVMVRSIAPGAAGLPHAADALHSVMHLGAAQLADRREPGRYGYFVKRARAGFTRLD